MNQLLDNCLYEHLCRRVTNEDDLLEADAGTWCLTEQQLCLRERVFLATCLPCHLGHLPDFYQPELLPPVLQVQASSPVLFEIDLLQCGLCRVTGLLQSQQVQPKSGVAHPQQLLHPPVLHIPAIICKDLQSTMARQVYTYICVCVSSRVC